MSVCPFVTLLKATYAENSHIVCLVGIKKRSFLTSCVFGFNFRHCRIPQTKLMLGKASDSVWLVETGVYCDQMNVTS